MAMCLVVFVSSLEFCASDDTNRRCPTVRAICGLTTDRRMQRTHAAFNGIARNVKLRSVWYRRLAHGATEVGTS